ncbi:unnamed protein product [Spirodela intermedia]|uniref:Uncharacterized protein n=2 Tax=Spirodela intermedia TaxID=51605 RepID=A0A7I8JGX4_SPIIN|nr:unnamed protein product [Spirodela intermedia]CAA6669005.1 unnamed protein product [Spirodela intermedia]CAA7405950.1 unnamed protein product [Spirodela intermedia]
MEKLAVVALLLLLAQLSSGQTRSMCLHQIAIVSQACIMIPWRGGGSPHAATALLEPLHSDHHGGDHRHHHAATHGHRRGHHHGHGHRHLHGSSAEEHCCRWLKEVDDVCVCDLLVRLPRFLTKPDHNFTVAVGNACNATYSCGGI